MGERTGNAAGTPCKSQIGDNGSACVRCVLLGDGFDIGWSVLVMLTSLALMILCVVGLWVDSRLRFDREIRKFFDDNG